MALLFLCLIFGTGRTQKIEAAVQNVSESLEEESRLDTVGTDQETERAAVREKKGQQEKEAGDTETDQAAAQDELLAELDFDAIQQEVDSLLSASSFLLPVRCVLFCRMAIPSAPSVPEMPFFPVPKQHSLRRRG